MMMISAGRDEGRLAAIFLHEIKTEHAAIELQCAVDIRYLQMHMADARSRGDGCCLRRCHQVSPICNNKSYRRDRPRRPDFQAGLLAHGDRDGRRPKMLNHIPPHEMPRK
jgi:hypothetical protein